MFVLNHPRLFTPYRWSIGGWLIGAAFKTTAQRHDADDCTSDSDQQHRQRPSYGSNRMVTLDENFEGPIAGALENAAQVLDLF
jgi:hypothetical protein